MRTAGPSENALTALFNKTRILLLSFLYNNPDKTFYLREIARSIDMAVGTVQRELARLVSAGLVVRRPRGKHVYYNANTKSSVYNEIRGLIIKTFGLSDIIKDALGPISKKIDQAFIYGSQADGTSTSDSDIDLMVIGDVSEMELHKAVNKAEAMLEKTINYSLFASKEFKERKKEKDGFIFRITTGEKIMLIGNEDEI
jgi:DNA-binding transcriptional ArsR family regulator